MYIHIHIAMCIYIYIYIQGLQFVPATDALPQALDCGDEVRPQSREDICIERYVLNIYVCMYVYIYIERERVIVLYIYIYIERERDR